MRSLGDVQYSTGIPQYYYNTLVPQKQRTELGGLGAVGDFFSSGGTTTTKGADGSSSSTTTGAGGFSQVSGILGAVGGIVESFMSASVEKKRIKMEGKIAEINAKFGYMTEKERIAANIEIQRIRSQFELLTAQESSRYGLGMTKILALAGVGSIGLIGMFAVLAKMGD